MIRCSVAVVLLTIFLSAPTVKAQEKSVKTASANVQTPLASFTHFSATMIGGAFKEEPRKIYRAGNLLRIDLDNEYHITDLVGENTSRLSP